MGSPEHHAAARTLLRGLSVPDAVRVLNSQVNVLLHDAETEKTHPLTSFALSAAEWEAFRAHLLDGGGVVDDADLGRTVLSAILADDQKTFWPAAIHLLKAWLKIRGHVEPLPHGGTKLNGV